MAALPSLCDRTEIQLHTVSDAERRGAATPTEGRRVTSHPPLTLRRFSKGQDALQLQNPVPGEEQIVRRVESYIRANANENLVVADLAAAASVSSRTLFRNFRRLRGRSPRQVLEQARLERARLHLLHGGPEDRVTRVASDSGFTHLGRFSGLYKGKYGETPSETLRQSRLRIQGANPRPRNATRNLSSDEHHSGSVAAHVQSESSGNRHPNGWKGPVWLDSDSGAR
jgi:AraC-like DNA-binding protein